MQGFNNVNTYDIVHNSFFSIKEVFLQKPVPKVKASHSPHNAQRLCKELYNSQYNIPQHGEGISSI